METTVEESNVVAAVAYETALKAAGGGEGNSQQSMSISPSPLLVVAENIEPASQSVKEHPSQLPDASVANMYDGSCNNKTAAQTAGPAAVSSNSPSSSGNTRINPVDANNDDIVLPAVPLSEYALQPATATTRNPAANSNSVELFHPACRAAALAEVHLAMSQMYHHHSQFLGLIFPSRIVNDVGTLKVQVLRSVGKWSVGTKTENSIMKCWLESIQSSLKFVYIESQFFLGNTAGADVSNPIAQCIVDRITRAFQAKEQFRVIIIVPVHPNGDFANAMKSKLVLHYQCLTINKGPTSMFALLSQRCPGIKISDYIGIFSLRNWGIVNNKVVSDQVYVHDKLLIVDDRVVVVGSANCNDRSMLGNRDSEVAIRIEDALHVDILMNATTHTVGYLPHSLRMQLMRQHLGDQSLGK